jgi:hypothetical protein
MGENFKKSFGASAETSRNKKYVAAPPRQKQGGKYISAETPPELKS